jgi:hypothetical protein
MACISSYRLSAEQIAMAKELGLNPKKFGSLANHHQEPWKAPLGDFIEEIYQKKLNKKKSKTSL